MTVIHKKIEHIFRPICELNIAFFWIAGGLLTPLISQVGLSPVTLSASGAISILMIIVGVLFLYQSLPLLKRQLKLSVNKKTFIDPEKLRKINRYKRLAKKSSHRETYVGKGYVWGSEHAQRAYQVMDLDSEMTSVKLPFFLRPVVKAMSKQTRELGGAPWIHGMGDEKKIMVQEENWFGHTFISGNVGTGKTTLLKLLTTNALHLGNVLIILDPKNDDDWRKTIQKEMKHQGSEDQFYHLHPSSPSTSARISLLKHYTRVTEIADRIAPLMGSKGGNKAFQDFAYGLIYHISQGIHYLGDPIRLTTIQKVISGNRRGLALRVLSKFYDDVLGQNWQIELTKILEKLSPDQLQAMAIYYRSTLQENLGAEHQHAQTVIEGILEVALHNEDHYTKMVVSLRPVLTALTAEPLNTLLSAVDSQEDMDTRPIIDIRTLVEKGGCIYISLDSLTDGTSAGFISRLVLAEVAAVAGERYNNHDKQARRVTVANDEVHASLENNDALLNMLAQGRAALMQMILATQTVSDLEDKTSKPTANRFLGLCNNFISMRSTDPMTQEYVAAQFNKTSISQVQAQSATGSSTNNSMFDYDATYGERLLKTREEMFPQELIGKLPILQYIARLADGRTLKMRLDVLRDK